MNYKIIKRILSSEEIIALAPLPSKAYQEIDEHRQEIKAILEGRDKRFLMVIGPCSAWPDQAVFEYAKRLKELSKKVNNVLKIVMRVYIQKPRTTKGWTGPINQPDPLKPSDIGAGIEYARKMMVEIVKMGLPIADEALFTHNARGFMELLSWVAIGARSAENQEHRIFASAIDAPVGLKNPTNGSLEIGVNSVIAAQYPHVAVLDGYEIQTYGNEYAHLVLRGSQSGPNYSIKHLTQVECLLKKYKVKNPSVMIDVSHGNCIINGKKEPLQQLRVVLETIENLKISPDLRNLVKGFMVESFIKEGKQDINKLTQDSIDLEGLSITDPCIGWDSTESLLLSLSEKVRAL